MLKNLSPIIARSIPFPLVSDYIIAMVVRTPRQSDALLDVSNPRPDEVLRCLHLIRMQRTGTLRPLHRFVERVAAALENVVRSRAVPALVIAAPPRTLADLRQAFHADVKKRIVAEVGKDLTGHPVSEIETHLLR